MGSAALGREWDDDAVAAILTEARVPFRRPPDIAEAVGAVLAEDGVVAWFQGRSEFGPRALGNRSLLANPSRVGNIDRLNAIKGRESFRPVAPMVRGERAADIFEGPLPSPYMLFVHRVRPEWAPRIPAALHVDGTARVQTVDAHGLAACRPHLEAVERRTGVPVVINTSQNPPPAMFDDPRDAWSARFRPVVPGDRLVPHPPAESV